MTTRVSKKSETLRTYGLVVGSSVEGLEGNIPLVGRTALAAGRIAAAVAGDIHLAGGILLVGHTARVWG
jgi:hypothetical protein